MECPSCNLPQPPGVRSFRVLDPETGLVRSVCFMCWVRAGTPDPPRVDEVPAVGIVEVEVEVGALPTQLASEDTTEPLVRPPARKRRDER